VAIDRNPRWGQSLTLFPDSFVTARLRAERLRAEHFDAVRAMDTDPQFMTHLGGTRDAAQTAAYMSRNLQHWDDYGFGLWILRDGGDQVTGRAVLRHLLVDGTDEVELGYGWHPRYWGRGLATEVAKALLQLARDELRIASPVAITLPANIDSQRVLVKAGLIYEREVMLEGLLHLLYRST